MRRILIIAPHFAPVAAPDGHRARLLLPHLEESGWKATVLTVDPAAVAAPREEELLGTLPPGADIRRVRAFSLRLGRWLGIGNLGWRALPWIWREGSRLLRRGDFDLVYFSTTQFAVLPLGRLWLRRFGVPYVIDLQDPWRNDYYARTGVRPPGGWKYRLASWQAARLEGWTLRRCAHVISVSPDYLTALAGRYPWFDARHRGTVIPFGWSERDLALARAGVAEPARTAEPDTRELLYLGRIGDDMRPALLALFSAFADWRRRTTARTRIRFRFAGTSYAPRAGRDSVVSRAAAETGVSDAVEESAARIGYLDALARMCSADALLLLGSDDPAYSPSKVWPVLATGRPSLAVTPETGVLAALLRTLAAAGTTLVSADLDRAGSDIAGWLERFVQEGRPPGHPVPERLYLHEAATTARAQARIFTQCRRPPHRSAALQIPDPA